MVAVTPFRYRQQLAVWTQGQLEGVVLVLIFGLGRGLQTLPSFHVGRGAFPKPKPWALNLPFAPDINQAFQPAHPGGQPCRGDRGAHPILSVLGEQGGKGPSKAMAEASLSQGGPVLRPTGNPGLRRKKTWVPDLLSPSQIQSASEVT